MQHTMRLATEPFSRIKSGTKLIEFRLYDEKRQKIKLGDTIVFTELGASDTAEKIQVRVTGLLQYKDFASLFDDIDPVRIGYKASDRDYLKESMYEIYTKEQEQQYGVLGIAFKVV